MFFLRLSIFFFLFLTGCQKYGVALRQQRVDPSYLASTHVGSPDPRQKCPPRGQMIIVEWWVPRELLECDPKVIVHMIFLNFTEKIVEFPINRRIGYETYKLLNDEFDRTKGILTYKAEIVTCDGEVFRQWKHQLWVNLIQVSDEEDAKVDEEKIRSTDWMSSSVVEKSRQGSVIDTPACNSLN